MSLLGLIVIKKEQTSKVNRPFPSSPWPLFENEVKCSAFHMEMIFHKKGFALGLILKVRVF